MASAYGVARARIAVAAVLFLSAGLVAPNLAAAQPTASATPTIQSVTAKLDGLARQTERLAEAYNKARIDVTQAQRAAAESRHELQAATTRYQSAHTAFVTIVDSQYENGTPDAASALLDSNSGGNYLDRLNILDLLAQQQSDIVTYLEHARTTQTVARAAAERILLAADAERRDVRVRRERAAAQTRDFQSLLRTLTAAQQAAYAARMAATAAQAATVVKHPTVQAAKPSAAPVVTTVRASSAAAQRAVDFALAQVGKPYVFGAAGPGSYDCSGLTMASWRAGGVSLPHLAAAQINYGVRVPLSRLQPGDLVFMYSPIGHVSIYVGHGMLVSAPQPGENVKIVPLAYSSSEIVGASRPG